MKFPTPRLWKIEKEIFVWREELKKEENKYFSSLLKKGVEISALESSIRMVTSDHKHTIDSLELERKFIIDRQNNLFWRIIWNVLVPIVVSVGTVYILSTLNL